MTTKTPRSSFSEAAAQSAAVACEALARIGRAAHLAHAAAQAYGAPAAPTPSTGEPDGVVTRNGEQLVGRVRYTTPWLHDEYVVVDGQRCVYDYDATRRDIRVRFPGGHHATADELRRAGHVVDMPRALRKVDTVNKPERR
jgi:hypothetical protein